MVVLRKLDLERISLFNLHTRQASSLSHIPQIDLSNPDKVALIRACKEVGFFKIINHGISATVIETLEAEALSFFSKPQREKIRAGHLGYGNKDIGPNGDVGWLEYLLLQVSRSGAAEPVLSLLGDNGGASLCEAMAEYLEVVRKLACRVLELVADGLGLSDSKALSRLLDCEESDTLFRLNMYPPCKVLSEIPGLGLTGFGEHTDPQVISVLRSNNINGLQILRDGSWLSVPSDHSSFFVGVGDILQVMTNGRFRSVRHRVLLGDSSEPRVSMVYFGGPPPGEKLAPLPMLMMEGEQSLYKEFTWAEYKKAAYKSRLADNRLRLFESWTEYS